MRLCHEVRLSLSFSLLSLLTSLISLSLSLPSSFSPSSSLSFFPRPRLVSDKPGKRERERERLIPFSHASFQPPTVPSSFHQIPDGLHVSLFHPVFFEERGGGELEEKELRERERRVFFTSKAQADLDSRVSSLLSQDPPLLGRLNNDRSRRSSLSSKGFELLSSDRVLYD